MTILEGSGKGNVVFVQAPGQVFVLHRACVNEVRQGSSGLTWIESGRELTVTFSSSEIPGDVMASVVAEDDDVIWTRDAESGNWTRTPDREPLAR
jgi:hypothetical protein